MYQRHSRFMAVLGLIVFCSIPCVAASHTYHASSRTHVVAIHAARGLHGSMKTRAVTLHTRRGRHSEYVMRAAVVRHESAPAMDPARATEIQAALIRSGYLSGEPTGVWDADSIAAMQKLQDQNGWQTKYTPDSRALVKLGLGAGALPGQTAQPTPAPSETAQAAPGAQP